MRNKSSLVVSLLATLAFVACDDSGSSASDDDYFAGSSSSVVSGSSSSVIPGSSSSVIPSNVEGSSDSKNPKTVLDLLNPKIDYGEFTDARDGQAYKMVKIGKQTWMAQNLNYAYGEPTATEDSSSFCYDNSADYCAIYGRLYLWSAAMDSAAVFSDGGKGCGDGRTCVPSDTVRGVCPEGWHLPSNYEWETLLEVVGGEGNAGSYLKSLTGWPSLILQVTNGVDAYGFSGYPVATRKADGNFSAFGDHVSLWSAEESRGRNAYYMYMFYYTGNAELRDEVGKSGALPVRCLKDADPSEEGDGSLKDSWEFLNPDVEYGEMVDERDEQVYKTVKIGDQTWMAENLNYDYNEGSAKGFCLRNRADSCAKYGRLYLWSAAMDSAAVFSDGGKGCGYYGSCKSGETVRGVCPEGWHLPSKMEWNTLFAAVGDTGVAGTTLKSQVGWKSDNGVPTGSDTYGFSASTAGYRLKNGDYVSLSGVHFWTSSDVDVEEACVVDLSIYEEDVSLHNSGKGFAFSVRCVMDN